MYGLFYLTHMYKKISEEFPYKVFFLTEFNNLPDFPGIYSWHLYCVPNNFTDYHGFYKSKKYKTSMKGFLQEKYTGDLYSKKIEFKKTVKEETLFKLASALFSPPLYIGITSKRTLKERLNEHKKSIEKSLNKIEKLYADKEISEENLDSEFESKVLGDRIARSLSLLSEKFNESNLFVKTIEINRDYDVESLKGIESILNRTINPILGRR